MAERSVAGRLRERLRRGDPPPPQEPATPVLSVIVPVYNTQDYLAECLDSVLAQTWAGLQVIVVDDGSTDGSGEIVARYAAQDDRVLAHHQRNAGLGAARNAGIELATGDYLTFVDSDDVLPPHAFQVALDSLEESGSDFAVGAVKRLEESGLTTPRFTERVHGTDRRGIRIDDFPLAMRDIVACNRVLRTSFWRDNALRFPEGVAYEDHLPMVRCYLLGRFDLLRRTTYHWRIRPDRSSIGQQKRVLSNLQDRLSAKAEAYRVVADHGRRTVTVHWLARVLDTDLNLFVEQVPWADEQYWRTLVAGVRPYVELADPQVWAEVAVNHRLRVWLVAQDRREDLERLLLQLKLAGPAYPVVHRDGRLFADPPALRAAALTAPSELLEVAERQTQFVGGLERVSVTDGTLTVEGWALQERIDLAGRAPRIALWLQGAPSDDIELLVEPMVSRTVNLRSGTAFADYSAGGFRASTRAGALLGPDRRVGDADWTLHGSITVDGIVREGPLDRYGEGTTAAASPSADLPYCQLQASADPGGLRVSRRARPLMLRDLQVDGTTLSATLVGSDEQVASVLARGRQGELPATLSPAGDGVRLSLDLAAADAADSLALVAVTSSGRRTRLPWPADVAGPAIVRGGLTLLRNSQGVLRVRPGRRQLPISGFRVTADEVVLLATTATATDPAGWELRLRSQRLTVPGTVAAGPDGSVTVTFALAADPWGSGPRPLGRGRYSVEAVLAPGATPVPVTIAPQDFDACDAELVTAAIAGRFLVGEDGALELAVLAPLADEERGAYHRERLRVAYRSREVAPEPRAVLFCSNRGDSATDSQLALHHELRRRGSDLTLYWVVSDHSVALPERAVPVVRDSAEYYRVVAAAGFLCNNSDFGHWFRKRDHQRFLQTFHGYPFKTMGISRWTDDGLSPAQIEAAVRHRRDAWDTILTPDPAMNEYYQREFGYDGEILSVGYPRNDALLAAGTEQVRARTREVVGVEPGQRAVLYAPTWRETLSTGAWSARMVDNLDLDALTEALGPDHVLLLRGHSFNARTRRRVTGSSRIVDVTDHPEINDLVLASDLAVLDYSSLRFDYALTGKPMLFYVPDLAAYRELSRGFLYDYEPTAPGPLVRSTAELAAAVLDLDEVRREYATAYEQFNARFNSRHDGHAAARVVDAFFATAAAPAKVDPPRSGREL